MSEKSDLNILFLAPYCDGNDVGESFNSHRWAKALSARVNLTVLSLHRKNQVPISEQLPDAATQSWSEPVFFQKFERFNAIAKPGYVKFYHLARKWIKDAIDQGQKFDLIHQMTPAALRYPSPGVGFNIPLVHGPIQGSIETPENFKSECNENSAWYMKLRNIDKLRLKHDPLLKSSYHNTDLILVGSRYVRDLLAATQPRRVEELVHLNIDGVVEHPQKIYTKDTTLKLLFVGRAVRTKGLLDLIRAIPQINAQNISLDIIGDGDNLSTCQSEANQLGITDIVTFHGKQPRNVVEEFYSKAHVLVFPSFREPAGAVVLEAMRHGLPVITTNIGGTGYYVNER